MDDIPELAPQPLFLEGICRHGRVAALGTAATAAGEAIRQVCPALDDIDRPAVGAHDTLSMDRAHGRARSFIRPIAAAAPTRDRVRRERPSRPRPESPTER